MADHTSLDFVAMNLERTACVQRSERFLTIDGKFSQVLTRTSQLYTFLHTTKNSSPSYELVLFVAANV